MKGTLLMKNKKDILFLCQYFYPEYVSSATLPFDTAIALSESGLMVEALCGYPYEYHSSKSVPMQETYKDIKINRLKYLKFKRTNAIGRLSNFLSFTLQCILNIFKLKNFKSVIVYSNPPVLPLVAIAANMIFGTKIVFVCYDVYPEVAVKTGALREKGLISTVMKFINCQLYKRAECVVALSEEMKKFLVNNRAVSEEKVVVIPNWFKPIESEYVVVENEKLKEIKQSGDMIVSYFGNMGICQDMDTILSAISERRTPKVKFLFAGHGNKLDNLKSVVAEKKYSNVYIFDFLHGDDFKYALSISDCFIVSLEEGLSGLCVPSKTYSYMAEGKPIVAIIEKETDIAKDLLGGNAGFVCKNGDGHGVAEHIQTLYENKELREIMSENCKQIFKQKYTTKICTNKYCEVMHKICES